MEDYSMRPVKRPPASIAVTLIVCIVFGLLSFVFAAGSATLFSVRDILSENAVSTAIGDINPASWEIGMFFAEDDIKNIAEKWYLPKDKMNEESTIAEIISDSAAQYKLQVRTEDIEALMDNSGIMPAIGGLLSVYENYILTGEDEEPFSAKALIAEVKRYRSDIKKYTGVDISIFYDGIEATLRENARTINKLNPSELIKGVGKYTSVVFSLPVIIGCLAMLAVMAGLAMLITRRPLACVRMLGIVLAVAGILLFVAMLLVPTALKAELPMLRANVINYISGLIRNYVSPILIRFGVIYAGAGLILIAVSIIFALFFKKPNAQSPETITNM